jgi:hypothetical protein
MRNRLRRIRVALLLQRRCRFPLPQLTLLLQLARQPRNFILQLRDLIFGFLLVRGQTCGQTRRCRVIGDAARGEGLGES